MFSVRAINRNNETNDWVLDMDLNLFKGNRLNSTRYTYRRTICVIWAMMFVMGALSVTKVQAKPLDQSASSVTDNARNQESAIDEVAAVTLLYFTATEENGDTLLAWKTTSEIDNQGFNIYRSETPEGPWTKVNFALVPARGTASNETRYTLTDVGYSGWYMLEDVDVAGALTQHPPTTSEGATAVPPPPPPTDPADPETPADPAEPAQPAGQTIYYVYIPISRE